MWLRKYRGYVSSTIMVQQRDWLKSSRVYSLKLVTGLRRCLYRDRRKPFKISAWGGDTELSPLSNNLKSGHPTKMVAGGENGALLHDDDIPDHDAHSAPKNMNIDVERQIVAGVRIRIYVAAEGATRAIAATLKGISSAPPVGMRQWVADRWAPVFTARCVYVVQAECKVPMEDVPRRGGSHTPTLRPQLLISDGSQEWDERRACEAQARRVGLQRAPREEGASY